VSRDDALRGLKRDIGVGIGQGSLQD